MFKRNQSNQKQAKKRQNVALLSTREQWLEAAVRRLSADFFAPLGLSVPRVRVSVGFTGARQEMKALGACWSPQAAEDRVAQIFITPREADSVRVLDVLLHELIHATIGNDKGHGPAFRKAALALGLTGKMTATVAGPELKERLNDIVRAQGAIPHARLDASRSGRKKQGTRLLKASCEQTGYTVRVTKTWVLAAGAPVCPCCRMSMAVDFPDNDEAN